MTQNPGQWGPQGGYPQRQGPGWLPAAAAASPGYPPQQPQPRDIHRAARRHIRSSSHRRRWLPTTGRLRPAARRTATASGRLPPQPAVTGRKDRGSRRAPASPQGGGRAKKSPALIIGIVVGGRGPAGRDRRHHHGAQPGRQRSASHVSITPSQPAAAHRGADHRSPAAGPSHNREPHTDRAVAAAKPAARSISATRMSLTRHGAGRSRRPVRAWRSCPTARTSSSGRSLQVCSRATNPGQLCTRGIGMSPRARRTASSRSRRTSDLGTTKLKAATCVAQVTVSSGQGSAKLYLFSLVSVRRATGDRDRYGVLHAERPNADQLNKDFLAMVNSMLKGQSTGG